MKGILIFALVLGFLPSMMIASGPVELGEVQWLRSMEDARQQSKVDHKPIFILFQEVPGCITCQRFGSEVLGHPLIVEAIETFFVPLAIFNNKGGKDKTTLDYFGEPSWNNPVVRIVDSGLKDIKPRLSGKYSAADVVAYMIAVMEQSGNRVPQYLTMLSEELDARQRGLEKATFSMFCFWTGEKELGKLPGVIETEAGFMDRHEVVNVWYDSEKISLREIIKEGTATHCADAAYLADSRLRKEATDLMKPEQLREEKQFSPDSQPKYYMSRTIYRMVPMTAMQAVKANALIGQGLNPEEILSPRQIAIARYAHTNQASWTSAIAAEDWKGQFFKRWQKVQSSI